MQKRMLLTFFGFLTFVFSNAHGESANCLGIGGGYIRVQALDSRCQHASEGLQAYILLHNDPILAPCDEHSGRFTPGNGRICLDDTLAHVACVHPNRTCKPESLEGSGNSENQRDSGSNSSGFHF